MGPAGPDLCGEFAEAAVRVRDRFELFLLQLGGQNQIAGGGVACPPRPWRANTSPAKGSGRPLPGSTIRSSSSTAKVRTTPVSPTTAKAHTPDPCKPPQINRPTGAGRWPKRVPIWRALMGIPFCAADEDGGVTCQGDQEDAVRVEHASQALFRALFCFGQAEGRTQMERMWFS